MESSRHRRERHEHRRHRRPQDERSHSRRSRSRSRDSRRRERSPPSRQDFQNVKVKQEPLSSDEENHRPRRRQSSFPSHERNEPDRDRRGGYGDNFRGGRRDSRVHWDPEQPRRRIKREDRPSTRPGGSGDDFEYGVPGSSVKTEEEPPQEKMKPDFGLSGKLAAETNMCNGILVKYSEPAEARKPKVRWRMYVFKGDENLTMWHIHRQSAYLMGRERKVADIPLDNPSISKQHAVLQYRQVLPNKRIRPYIMDLGSANGTYLNNKLIEPQRYVELFEKDVLKFGYSEREYVLLHEGSKDSDADSDTEDSTSQ